MMTANKPINIRLSKSEQEKYESQAASFDLPLRTYLRQKLEYSDNILEEITALRSNIKQIIRSTRNNDANEEMSMLLEILLLLRQIAQPKQVFFAQQEVKRLGFSTIGNKKEYESRR